MRVVKEQVLREFRGDGPCERCKKWSFCRHAAHVMGRGQEGATRLDHRLNLVSLCWQCHRNHHEGRHPNRGDLLLLVSVREGVCIEKVIGTLTRLREMATPAGRKQERKRRYERRRALRLVRGGRCRVCALKTPPGWTRSRCEACIQRNREWEKRCRQRAAARNTP